MTDARHARAAGSASHPAPASAAAGDAVARLWLATLQDVVARAAHDVKNLLNGVAVNLEVVRSRASRPGAEAAAVRPFAESAVSQFERLSAVTEALLALARPVREPVDVVESWNAVATLAVPAAAGGGEDEWRARPPADGADTVAAGPGESVRLALAAAALAAAECAAGRSSSESGRGVTCTVSRAQENGSRGPEIRVAVACGAIPALRDGVAAAVAASGIRVGREKDVLILSIPAAGAPTAA